MQTQEGSVTRLASGPRFLMTGCSGGGKSTLLAALAEAGLETVAEPGRRIIAEERARGGHGFPWQDPKTFASRAAEIARADLARVADIPGPVFFDRGLLEPAVALERICAVPLTVTLGPCFPYSTPVFLAPPWAEIFVRDEDRRHSFADARVEYDVLSATLDQLGCKTVILPKLPVAARVAFLRRQI